MIIYIIAPLLNDGRVQKFVLKNMENSIKGEGGSARIIFHIQFFLVPNGIKINSRH